MKIQWSDEKIYKVTKSKLQKAKREAAFIDNKNVCPLCFGGDLKVIKADKAPECQKNEVKFTAICRECKIKVFYYKKIEKI